VKNSIIVSAMLSALLFLAGCWPASASCLAMGLDLFPIKDLPLTQDANFTLNLQDILNGYRYTENYSAGQFDCMDTCLIATRILQEYGYNPFSMARFALKTEDGQSHIWLSVSDGLGRFAFIDTAAFAGGRPVLGELMGEKECANYSSGYLLISPMKVMQCFGYSEDRFLSNLGKVEKTVPGRIVLREEDKEKRRWVYQ
jgi:hypothetical protein